MMQTFLPYPDFGASAAALDWRRLGKQRIEVLQLLRALAGESTGWANHPAARMWRGHEHALCEYGLAVVDEWCRRGYRDTCGEKIAATTASFDATGATLAMPPWLGDPAFHAAHRSNLLRKMPEHYRRFWPDEPDDLPYVWPVPEGVR